MFTTPGTRSNRRRNPRGRGILTAPVSTTLREVLTANRTYYVRTDGADGSGHTGLSNAAGDAFLTMQKAFDTIKSTLDVAGYTVTIQMAAGTYSDALSITPWIGGGRILLQGDTGGMNNVILSNAFPVSVGSTFIGTVEVGYVKFTASSSVFIDLLSGGGRVEYHDINCAGSAFYHLRCANPSGQLIQTGDYTISAGAINHINVTQGGFWQNFGFPTITISGSPVFSGAFVAMDVGGTMNIANVTFSGSLGGGSQYSVTNGAVLKTNGLTLPGTGTSGGTTTGGGFFS